jgi:putative salt-induced outer membrane protein
MRHLPGLLVLALSAALPAVAQETAPAPPETTCPCPPPPPPPPHWTGGIGAGLALTSGNSDTKSYNLTFGLAYDPKTRNVFKADGLYLRSDTDGAATVNRTTARVRDEYGFGKRAFVFGEVGYQRDEFKQLSYLIAPLAGVGYRVVDQEKLVLSLDGGVGGAFEKYQDRDSTQSGAVKAGESLAWKISGSSSFTQGFSGLWKMQDFGAARYHVGAGITSSVARRFELKLAYTYDYDSRPPSPTIKKGDNSLLAALVFKIG